MKRVKRKRFLAGFSCFLLCFTLNVNPFAVICGAIADSGIVDRFVNLKDNLIYIASNGSTNMVVKADEGESGTGTTYSFECDASTAIDTLMGTGDITMTDLNSRANEIKTAINTLNTSVGSVNTSVGNVNTSVGNVNTSVQTLDTNMQLSFTTLNGKMDDVIEELGDVNDKLSGISEQLAAISNSIESMQHNYRVAHLYSLNNTYDNCLWKPQSEDIPYVKDFATVTGQFANVYTGYWDTDVSTLNNPGGLTTKRAQEILGYDIIVRSEGLVLQKDLKSVSTQNAADGLSGHNQSYKATDDKTNATNSILVYYQEIMPETNITWIDAVTTLYRALGQEQISYQSFMSADKSITPETSPVYQGLSNPTPDENGNYAGYDFYMFLTRANVISSDVAKSGSSKEDIDTELAKVDRAKINYIYWEKAINGGFIPSKYINSAREPITFAEFFKLASRMMQAYGEPVLNDDELKALLQVYGTHYPIQLGTDIADAWAYMAARGILDFSEFTEGQESILYDITYTGYISRDQLLTMCMRIKDTDSRTDYKKINIILNLSDVMQEDYYYPVYDMQLTNGQFATATSYDHTAATNYDYLVRKSTDVTLGEIGTPIVFSEKTTDMSKRISDANVESMPITLTDGTEWYHVSVPKSYTGNFYIAMHTEGDAKVQGNTVAYIEVPSSALGGGYFSKYSVSGDTATVSVESGAYLLFDKMSEYVTRNCTDYIRAKEEKPKPKEVASNATVLEWLSAKVDEYTTPMTVCAAQETAYNPSEYGWRCMVYSDTVSTSSNSQRIYSLNDYSEVLGDSHNISGFDNKFFNGSSNDISVGLFAGTSQDMIALNRLCALWQMGTNLRNGDGTYSSYCKKFLLNDSLKEAMEDYLFNSNNGNASAYTSATSTWDMIGPWNRLNGNKTKDVIVNWPSSLTSSETWSVKMNAETFLTQFLLATKPITRNCGPAHQVTNGTAYRQNMTYSPSWNADVYSTSNEEYVKFLKDSIDILFTDAQNELYSKWLSTGVMGAEYSVSNGYKVYGSQEGIQAVQEDLVDSDTIDKLNKATASALSASSVAGSSLETSVATSTIMDRKQQILISWEDMCNSGYIVNTGSFAQPTMRDNGAYYFMTKEGQVIVNDRQHTIQIGNTLYDLMQDNGYAPTLVYIDEEQDNMMYFDYRCIMGVVRSQFTVNDGKTETFQNHLGVGDCVVYDLQSNGVTSDWYNTISVRCYNYPETPSRSGNGVTSSLGYGVNLIKSTLYDGETAGDTTYWADSNDISRLRMSTFVPTANYLCFIKDTDDGMVAQLYVYYLRTAFENGFVDSDGTEKTVTAPKDVDVRWNNLADTVNKASLMYSSGGVSLATQLENVYGYSPGDSETPWYIKMTYDAIANLYSYTGKYYFSQDYIIRRFDITDLSISNCIGWDAKDATGESNVELKCNDPGAIYWVDSIGFIYNMPSEDEFTLEKYLNGEYLLPLALDESNAGDPMVINYNINYYGTSIGFNGSDKVEGIHLPYGVVLSMDSDNPYIDTDGNVYSGLGSGDVAKYGDEITSEEGSEKVLPFRQSFDTSSNKATWFANKEAPNYFIPAPVGIYNKFGGNTLETMSVNEITKYVTDAAKVYYGSTQIKLDSSDSQSTAKQFKFVSTDYNPIALDGGTAVYRVYRSATAGDALIVDPGGIIVNYGSGVGEVEIDDYYTNPLEDWLDGLGTSDLITKIDEGASFLIIFAFKVMPIIGIILMTILIGFSFIGDIKLVQTLCDKFIDPVRILTFGGRSIHNWSWKRVLVPCVILYIAFALFLNGNLIRIIMWGAKWYGVIMQWAKSL